ncbi:pyocin knob domain-containing protein [Lentilactobacillus buchneri]|uniref:pyocin knob domain-containing protein n=1 Tax=Lentilactobacillus buchneri TaxID=1581 RepID=UPI0002075F03|nr:pyocin knob domain-containing protein [Lentilactobacillus buchneri]AEB73648.1 hypothetical protein Lbuc_1394 [Lentilactobacillus buchneri NRRL B-30929]
MPATWGKNTLTNQALTMMNQALGISAITFTKAVTITDDITGDSVSQLQALTSVNYKQSRTPKAIATQDNKSRLGVTIDNSDVNEDYIYYGVGLYAKQNSTNQEVLFSVIPLTAGATMIAKENNATTASIYLDLYTDIVRGTQVTIMVSNSGTLSREDVQQMISHSIGNALNYPNETASKGTDFNTILDISITRIIKDTTVVNAPSGFSGTGYLTTIGSGDKTVPIMQTLDDTINNIRSTRYFNSTTNVWSEWNAYAKTVDVNQQLDKKVNVSDMRKPASDVAGIEEVNAKQDKIGYTPADDSKVVHDNHDGTISANGASILPANENIIGRIDVGYTDMNDIPMGWMYLNGWAASGLSNWGLPQDFYYVHCFKTGYGISTTIQIAYGVQLNNTYMRTMYSTTWTTWKLLADDSKVPHLSGANNFDTVPTVNNNPLLLASSLPSDLARTGQTNTFTAPQTFSIAPVINDASKDKGDNQAATMADLQAALAKLPKTWNGTQAQFDAITTKDPNTYYYIYDDDAS